MNNAGVMCFGELEWQTENQIEQIMQVNVLGNVRVTRSLLPLIRRHKSRIINVTSHCALQVLEFLKFLIYFYLYRLINIGTSGFGTIRCIKGCSSFH